MLKGAIEIGPPCFTKVSRCLPAFATAVIAAYQIGIMTAYVQFVASNLKAIVDDSLDISLELYTLFLFIFFILINAIRELKYLTPFSILSNVMSIVSFVMVLYYVLQDMPSFSERKHINNLMEYPVFFGTAFFALHAFGLMISLEQSMKNPAQFTCWYGILNVSLLIVTLLYTIFSVLGYWKYGDKAEASITLNIPKHDA